MHVLEDLLEEDVVQDPWQEPRLGNRGQRNCPSTQLRQKEEQRFFDLPQVKRRMGKRLRRQHGEVACAALVESCKKEEGPSTIKLGSSFFNDLSNSSN